MTLLQRGGSHSGTQQAKQPLDLILGVLPVLQDALFEGFPLLTSRGGCCVSEGGKLSPHIVGVAPNLLLNGGQGLRGSKIR